jgi:hypothetical protein
MDRTESRRHPRYRIPRLHASIRPDCNDEWTDSFVSSARNLSLGGLFLRADWRETDQFVVGQVCDVTVFRLDNPEQVVVAPAQVARQAPDGIALEWRGLPPETHAALARIISSGASPPID